MTKIAPNFNLTDINALRDGVAQKKAVNVAGENADLSVMIKTAKKCLGGYIFRSNDKEGYPIVCFAVPNLSTSEEAALGRHYRKMVNVLPANIAHRNGEPIERVGDYTVFKFDIDTEACSLREWICEKPGECTGLDKLMKKLVSIIVRANNNCAERAEAYEPCYLTLDTVYMDRSAKHMTILPLCLFRSEFVAGLAYELYSGDEVGEKTDLFSAAYLATLAASKGEPKPGCEPLSGTLTKCMQVFPAFRPDLQTVSEELCAAFPPAPVPPAPVLPATGWLQKLGERWKAFCADLMSCGPEECEERKEKAGTLSKQDAPLVRKVKPIFIDDDDDSEV